MAQTTTERTAARIRGLLGERRLSVRQLAASMGVPSTTLARRLRGEYPLDLAELDSIAHVLGVTVSDLIVAGALPQQREAS